MKKIQYVVVSLFDGMSCGRVAFDRTEVDVVRYYSSEIKPHALKVASHHYPQDDKFRLGDVTKIDGIKLREEIKKEFPSAKIILIGGSPCQDFTILKANKRLGLQGDSSKLFYEYFRLYNEIMPDYYLLENVLMSPESKDQLTKYMKNEPIYIDSALVSFATRKRLYWSSIPNVTQIEDKKISFQDYKEDVVDSQFVVKKTPSREKMWGNGKNGKCPNVTHREKINCLTCKQDRWNNAGLVEYGDFCRYLTVRECELAMNIPIGYCSVLSKGQAYDLLGDGWTVDVVAHFFRHLPVYE